jgi:alkylhydroperoxidase family enzyme
MARIEPLAPQDWPKEMQTALAALAPPKPRHPRPIREGRPRARNTLGTFAHHPELAQAFFTYNGHILLATTLSERQRELLIMRVAAVRSSGYEWAQHLFMARDAGLSDEEMGRIAYGPSAPFWNELDAALLRAVDELILDGAIAEPTWNTLTTGFGVQQILDIIFTIGAYDTLARMFRSFELDIDKDVHELMGFRT